MRLKEVKIKRSGKCNKMYDIYFETEYGEIIKIEFRTRKDMNSFIALLKEIEKENKETVSRIIKELVKEVQEKEKLLEEEKEHGKGSCVPKY